MGLRRARIAALLVAVTSGAVVALLGSQTTTQTGDPVAQRETAAPDTTTSTTTSSVSGPPSTSTPPPAKQDGCAEVVASLPMRQRLAQLLMVGVDPSSADSAARLARAEGVGGIFLGGNETGLLVDGRLGAVQQAAELPVAVSIDEEGGRVQRIDELDGDVPSARVMAKSMTVDEVRAVARKRGAAMRARGVTVDFAPVVDVTSQPDDDVIGDRSFGSDPAVVARYADAFARGLADSGVLPVVKHFPGHGRASGDSHQSAVTTPTLADLRKVDLVPYRQLLGADRTAVMVGHMAVPGLTGGLPASLSPATYRMLRGELSFDGLVLTDDLGGMQAVSGRYPLPQAVLASLAAGADIALWSSGEQQTGEVLDVLEGAVADKRLPTARVDEALGRVLRAKAVCSA